MPSRLPLTALVGLALVATACTTDPAPTCTGPAVLIRKDRVDPPQPGAFVWNVQTTMVYPFTAAVVTTCPGVALHYAWYYDVPWNPPVLDSFQVCGSTGKCSIQLCAKPNNQLTDHTVLAVVSTGALKPDAKGPYDFPPGVSFDSVEWHIKKIGDCP